MCQGTQRKKLSEQETHNNNIGQTGFDGGTRISLIQINIAVIAGILTAINLDIGPAELALYVGIFNISTFIVVEMPRVILNEGSVVNSRSTQNIQFTANTITLNTIGLLFIGASFFVTGYPTDQLPYSSSEIFVYFLFYGLACLIYIQVNYSLDNRLPEYRKLGLVDSLTIFVNIVRNITSILGNSISKDKISDKIEEDDSHPVQSDESCESGQDSDKSNHTDGPMKGLYPEDFVNPLFLTTIYTGLSMIIIYLG